MGLASSKTVGTELKVLIRAGETLREAPRNKWAAHELRVGALLGQASQELLVRMTLDSVLKDHPNAIQIIPTVHILNDDDIHKDKMAQIAFKIRHAAGKLAMESALAVSPARYIVQMVTIGFHANALIVDTETGTAVWCEPHGGRAVATSNPKAEPAIEKYLEEVGLRNAKLLDAVWDDLQEDEPLCQTWAAMLVRWVLMFALYQGYPSLADAAMQLQSLHDQILAQYKSPRDRKLVPLSAMAAIGSAGVCLSKQTSFEKAQTWLLQHSPGMIAWACGAEGADGKAQLAQCVRLMASFEAGQRIFNDDGSITKRIAGTEEMSHRIAKAVAPQYAKQAFQRVLRDSRQDADGLFEAYYGKELPGFVSTEGIFAHYDIKEYKKSEAAKIVQEELGDMDMVAHMAAERKRSLERILGLVREGIVDADCAKRITRMNGQLGTKWALGLGAALHQRDPKLFCQQLAREETNHTVVRLEQQSSPVAVDRNEPVACPLAILEQARPGIPIQPRCAADGSEACSRARLFLSQSSDEEQWILWWAAKPSAPRVRINPAHEAIDETTPNWGVVRVPPDAMSVTINVQNPQIFWYMPDDDTVRMESPSVKYMMWNPSSGQFDESGMTFSSPVRRTLAVDKIEREARDLGVPILCIRKEAMPDSIHLDPSWPQVRLAKALEEYGKSQPFAIVADSPDQARNFIPVLERIGFVNLWAGI